MKPLPIFGTGIRSYSEVVNRQRRVNCYYDQRKDQDKNAVIVRGTPGVVEWATIPASPIRGFHVVGSFLYLVADTSLYKVSTGGSSTFLGYLPTVSRRVHMRDNGAQILIVDGVTGYSLDLSTLVITTISDPNFPYGCTSFTFFNSAFYAANPSTREFVKSALLDATLWTPLVFGTKERTSDNLLVIDALKDTLVLYGVQSVEFWQDAGLSPLPVQYITGSAQQWGLAADHSLAHIGNTAIFLGRNPDGGLSVVRWNGYSPDIISDSDLESIIDDMTYVDDATALVYHSGGHSFYQITFPAANRTFLFDATTGIWGEAQSGVAEIARHRANFGISFNKKNLFADTSSGVIYYFDPSSNTDDGDPILRELCTRHIYSAGNDQFLSEFYLDMEVGHATANLGLEISEDGGKTFGPQRQIAIGPIGAYGTRTTTRRLGCSTDFVIRIRLTDDVPFVITNAAAEMEVTGI